jgi:GT2 family glycosyltransferase
VFLLNSDMLLDRDALAELLPLRRDNVFAIGSRIIMADGSLKETNWTSLRLPPDDAAEIVELDPAGLTRPQGSLYAGGGSSLFRTSLLRRYVRIARPYAPFYWEDVEWGTLAWRDGYRCIFCPTSLATHTHRGTIARFYAEAEINRIFQRNRLLYHLRNLSSLQAAARPMVSLDAKSWMEIVSPLSLLSLIRARTGLHYCVPHDEELLDLWESAIQE